MTHLLLCLGAGIVIGIAFTLLRLPVPVPHGWGGLVGLFGMFLGGIAGGKILALLISRAG
ncbi:MAG: XapX domain-containing protein [Spirochaetaceae bacterium]|nr:XapX domain-containing protein [Spirochaetaceae bacterium]